MNYFDIPLVVLLVSTVYLCVVYLGLGLLKRSEKVRSKPKPIDLDPLDSTDTV